MQNRTPIAKEARPPLPDFTPVPRKYRHDGWTPERQKAFIAALADTGSVSRAAAMVNMAQTNCYTLRRARGGELSAGVGGGARFRARAAERYRVRARDRRLSGAGLCRGQADGLPAAAQ